MKVIKKINEIKKYLMEKQLRGMNIGFVPTMGYLHEGHLSLIRQAAAENDIVVISIFINPIQFGVGEDFERYPKDLERDIRLAEGAGADVLFYPEVYEMYPNKFSTYIEVNDITAVLCGASRPGHFRGVTTVVTKLFNIVRPNRAYFGQKDAQQAIVIQKMVMDLNIDVEIVVCPIIREADGLALSSRNAYLKPDEREQATIIYKSLLLAKDIIFQGERDGSNIRRFIVDTIEQKSLAAVDYVEIVDTEELKKIDFIDGKILIAAAVRFGSTRLVDNIIVEV